MNDDNNKSDITHIPQHRLLSVLEAVEVLGISRNMVYQLMQTNQLRSVKIGRRRLIPMEAIDRFIENLQLFPGYGATD